MLTARGLCVIAGYLSLAQAVLAAPPPASAPATQPDPVTLALIQRLVGGDESVRAALSTRDPEAVEAAVMALIVVPEGRISQLVGDLGDDDHRTREAADRALRALSRSSLPELQRHLAEADLAEVRMRLVGIIRAIASQGAPPVQRAEELLASVQNPALFAKRMAQLAAKPMDRRVIAFFRVANFNKAWEWLGARSKEEQLRYLLVVIYSGPSKEAASVLPQYDGYLVLKMASQTYWPVELQAPQRDGAYLWTYRAASIDRNTAQCVLQMSLNPAAGKAAEGPWVHFHVFEKMIYIWRYERAWLGTYDGLAYGVNPASYGSLGRDLSVGFTRSLHVNRIPKGVGVPTIRMGSDESGDWAGGTTYEWARDLFPPEYRSNMRFSPNKRMPPAQIIERPTTQPATP